MICDEPLTWTPEKITARLRQKRYAVRTAVASGTLSGQCKIQIVARGASWQLSQFLRSGIRSQESVLDGELELPETRGLRSVYVAASVHLA